MGPAGQQADDPAVARGIARPPFLYLACLLLGLALDRVLPLPLLVPEAALIRWTVGGGPILIGVAIGAAGVRNFSLAATPVPSNQPVRALVTTGILSRAKRRISSGASATPTATTRRVSAAGCSR
jgi:hypothetical protein